MKSAEEHLELSESKLKSAEVLLQNELYADSISRAYYSMFNAAKALLLTEDSSPKTHTGVSSELGKLFRDRIDRELLSELTRLQDLREKADYTNYQPDREETREAIETAEEFLKESKRICEK
ncbi:MAG: HEPN domain-containing protein [Candidatus Nanohalobium sp.]